MAAPRVRTTPSVKCYNQALTRSATWHRCGLKSLVSLVPLLFVCPWQVEAEPQTGTTTETTTTATTTTFLTGEAPAPSPNIFETRMRVDVSFVEEPGDVVLVVMCDGLRIVVANETGTSPGVVRCTGFTNQRFTVAGTAQFDLQITSESEEGASRATTQVSELVPAEVTTALQTQIQNDASVPDEVKNDVQTIEVSGVLDVVTQRTAKVRATRGGLAITVVNTEYTNQDVIDFIMDTFVQALENTTNTNVHADNITLSVDASNIRFTILSYEAEEDLAIMDKLSQADSASMLQRILDGSNVEIIIDGLTVNWEIYGTLTIGSGAVTEAEQQKLTDSSVYSIESMQASLSAYAQSQYGLARTQLGFHLLKIISYEEGDNTSNKIVVTYSYAPATFGHYCNIAEQQVRADQQAAMEDALRYEDSDVAILPRFEVFVQDAVLAACRRASTPVPVEDDTSIDFHGIAMLVALGVTMLVIAVAMAARYVIRRRHKRPDVASKTPVGEDPEAGWRGFVPKSTVQAHSEKMSNTTPVDDQMLEYPDDEPRPGKFKE